MKNEHRSPRFTRMFANHYENNHEAPFQHFFSSAFVVRLHGFKEPVVEVRVFSRAKGPDDGGYWGWYDNKRAAFVHVWPSKMQVEMCFPNITFSEECGDGLLLPVTVALVGPAVAD